MKEHLDVDISDELSANTSMREAGDRIVDAIISVANGRLTTAEVVGHAEFAPIPVGL
jgi:altronate dehydratase